MEEKILRLLVGLTDNEEKSANEFIVSETRISDLEAKVN